MTESLDESHKLHKGLIFLGLIFPGIYFFWVSQKMSGPSPPVMYMSGYTPWVYNLGHKTFEIDFNFL